jgi:2-amino-4-hydroxy-6-hydroxymethyldihydropteridine diphosphokinase
VAIALGANFGAPRRQLLTALANLSRHLGPLAVAPLFRSAAVSPISQPDFLNSVAVARTALLPAELLALLKALERAAGRQPGPPLGPRPLDLDLLLWGNRQVTAPGLEVPHPRLAERGFVLAPLAALLPALPVPGDGRTPAALLAALPPDPSLVRVSWTGPESAAAGGG